METSNGLPCGQHSNSLPIIIDIWFAGRCPILPDHDFAYPACRQSRTLCSHLICCHHGNIKRMNPTLDLVQSQMCDADGNNEKITGLVPNGMWTRGVNDTLSLNSIHSTILCPIKCLDKFWYWRKWNERYESPFSLNKKFPFLRSRCF